MNTPIRYPTSRPLSFGVLLLFALATGCSFSPCSSLITVDKRGVSQCGKSATLEYPAKEILGLLGPADRKWSQARGLPVQTYIYDQRGLSVREPLDPNDDRVEVMLQVHCKPDSTLEMEPMTGFVGVLEVGGGLKLKCGMTRAEVLAAAARQNVVVAETKYGHLEITQARYLATLLFEEEDDLQARGTDPFSYFNVKWDPSR